MSSDADTCTEYISNMVSSASTYSTETSTECQTITACDAKPTTITSTITETDTVGPRYIFNVRTHFQRRFGRQLERSALAGVEG